ncbi:MAG TPA: MBOAT family protein [Polyangia bacterium]|nr:MBOAT family protein [Polyangia bacterium]
MLFDSVEYAVLLVAAFAGVWLLARFRLARTLLLLSASYIFYGFWNWKYLGLIFLSSSHDYLVGRALGRVRAPAGRKALLGASVVVNLGILCAFKYFDFFVDSAADLLAGLGFAVSRFHLGLVLPVGISFYTFQTLSYTIDVFRGRLEPTRSYPGYLLFVSFFPQLVAGPIVRASHLLPQLDRGPVLTAERGSRALFLIGVGLAKKVVIADFLGAHLADKVFSDPSMYSSVECLAGVYAYAFQIYADFSAYSDIAIGSAALLGFDIPLNFDAPYRSASLREFWRRWHISLSTWLRDYLYIPLGGSRHGRGRTAVSLLATMLLGGLWHGAALTFVFWGAIHGLALATTRLVPRPRFIDGVPPALRRALGVLVTFHVVCAAWVFFRAPDFRVAGRIFESIAALDLGVENLSWSVLAVLAVAFATHWIPAAWIERARRGFHALPAPLQAATLLAVILAVHRLARVEVQPFIYFQF